MTKPVAALRATFLCERPNKKILVENIRQTATKRGVISNDYLVF